MIMLDGTMRTVFTSPILVKRILIAATVASAYTGLAWRYDQWRGWHKISGGDAVYWFAAVADFLRYNPFGHFEFTYGNVGLALNALTWGLLCLFIPAAVRRFRHAA